MKLNKKNLFYVFIFSVVIGAAYVYTLKTNNSLYIENFSSSCDLTCILLWIFVWIPLITVGIYIVIFVILFGGATAFYGSQSVNQSKMTY